MKKTRKTKILGFLNAFSEGASGGDVAFIEILKRADDADITIITSKLGAQLCKARGLKAHFILTTHEDHFTNVIGTYIRRILLGCLKVLGQKKPDVLYVSSDVPCDVLPAIVMKVLCFFTRKKVVVLQKYYHINNPNRRLSYLMQRFSFWLFPFYADKVCTCSHISKKHIESLGIKLPKMAVNYLGLDYSDIRAITPVKESYDVVFLGRLKVSKGVFDLPAIWQEVVKSAPNTRLAIIGDGPKETRKKLEDAFQKHGVSKQVDILGFRECAYSILRSAKLFISTSHEEGFGIVLAEAMACGVPIVAYDLPVFKECFTGSFRSVESFNTESFAKTVLDVLADPSQQKELIESGFKKASSLDWSHSAQREWEMVREMQGAAQNGAPKEATL